MQGSMLIVSAAGAAVAVAAEVADYRRRNRRDVDAVGFMPWRGIALVGVAVAILAAALALKPETVSHREKDMEPCRAATSRIG